jgi:hypothetical protein
MRVLTEIPHPAVKITVFAWNGKYIIKLERGSFEQTYKISEMDILDEADIPKLLDETFIDNALQRFAEMNKALQEAQERLE